MADVISDGVYRISTALAPDDVCCDVATGSVQAGANLQLYGANGTPSQCFRVTNQGSGYITLTGVKGGKLVDVTQATAADGTNIQMWNSNSTDAQTWLPVADGTMTVNGQTVTCYRLESKLNTGYALDAAGGSSALHTNVQLWHANGTDAQRWAFVRTSPLDDSVPVPANLGLSRSVGGSVDNVNATPTYTPLFPTWECLASAYQARYRTRSRATGGITWSDWTVWHSVADGTATDDGWGNGWTANCTPAQTMLRKWSPTSIALDFTSADAINLQYEVRAFDASTGTHSGAVAGTWRCTLPITASVTSATWAPDGLRIVYTSTAPSSGGNVFRVSSPGLFDEIRRTLTPSIGTILVPQASLRRIPADGDSISVRMGLMTKDGATVSVTQALTVSYDTGHGETITPSVTVGGDYIATVVIGSHASTRCWAVYGGVTHAIDESSTAGTYRIMLPFGLPYQIFALADDSTDSTSKWDTWHASYPAFEHPYHMLNTDDGGYLVIGVNVGDAPGESIDIAADYDSALTTDAEFENIHMSGKTSRGVKVDGVLVADMIDGSSLADLDPLIGQFAWYRDPGGDVWRVAVTAASIDRTSLYDKVSVTMRRTR